MINWNDIRKDFPVTEGKYYFISAGMSPIPTPIFNYITGEYRDLNVNGDIHWREDLQKFIELKAKVGSRLNTEGEDIAFLQNTSLAMSLVAISLKKKFGDDFNIISMMDEFPSTTVPYEYQGIKVKYLEPKEGRYPVEDVLHLIDGKTRAVVTSYVQYCTGFRQNLEKLGDELKKRGILLIVNATQAFPIFPVDVKKFNIDVMTASVHKWGFTGFVGTLFYTSKKYRKDFPAPVAGWLSVMPAPGDFIYTEKNGKIILREDSDQYLFGSMNFNVVNAFAESLSYLERIGQKNITDRIFELTDYLIGRLKEAKVKIISPVASRDERSAIVAVRLDQGTQDCVQYLEDRKIYTSFRNQNMRISLNIFNSKEEIDHLIETIKEFLKR